MFQLVEELYQLNTAKSEELQKNHSSRHSSLLIGWSYAPWVCQMEFVVYLCMVCLWYILHRVYICAINLHCVHIDNAVWFTLCCKCMLLPSNLKALIYALGVWQWSSMTFFSFMSVITLVFMDNENMASS